MEKLFTEELQQQIREILSQGQKHIRLVLFTKTGECHTCEETKQLLEETAELSDKITLEVKDIDTDKAFAQKYNVTMTPSFIILDETGAYKGVKFNGIPAGHEINAFISALLEMSGVEVDYGKLVMERIAKIDKKINIKVFVTLSCPHCSGAVQNAHRLAMLNSNVEGEMIEAQTFYTLSEKYNVSGVPKIVINEHFELIGNQPIEAYLDIIEKL